MFIYLIKLKIYSDLFIKKNKYDYRKGYIKSNKIVVVINGNLINGITNDIFANRGDILFESELLNEVNDKIDFYIFPNY